MLGLPYDYAIDVWSAACSLFELYTGRILFPGHSNNQMLRLIMDTKGRFPMKMLKGAFADEHFDNAASGSFVFVERVVDSKGTLTDARRKVVIPVKPSRDIKSRLLNEDERRRIGNNEDELKLVQALVDFLDKALTLNPEKRLNVRDALTHPFITGKL